MNLIILIVENEIGKIALVKSNEFGDSFTLPFINSNNADEKLIIEFVQNKLGLLANSIDIINSGEYIFNNLKEKYTLIKVIVTGSDIKTSSNFSKALFQDPHKALKLIFTEPFTLNIVDYLKSK